MTVAVRHLGFVPCRVVVGSGHSLLKRTVLAAEGLNGLDEAV